MCLPCESNLPLYTQPPSHMPLNLVHLLLPPRGAADAHTCMLDISSIPPSHWPSFTCGTGYSSLLHNQHARPEATFFYDSLLPFSINMLLLEQFLFLAAHSTLRHSPFRQACCFTTAPAGGHPSSSTRNVQEPGLPTRWSFWLATWRTAEGLHLAPILFFFTIDPIIL